MAELFTDLAISTLSAQALSGTTTLVVQSGDGAKYPSPTGADFFRLFLFKKSTGEYEYVTVSARSGDTLTCTATSRQYEAGDIAELRPTAAFFNSLSSGATSVNIQQDAFRYAASAGAADAYTATMTPTATTYATGMTVILKINAAHTNTGGAATLKLDALAAKSIKMRDGSDPVAGAIRGSAMHKFTYDGTNFILEADGLTYNGTAYDANAKNIGNVAAGVAGTDVATIGGSETLTGKTLTSPTINGGTLDAPTAGDKAISLDDIRGSENIRATSTGGTATAMTAVFSPTIPDLTKEWLVIVPAVGPNEDSTGDFQVTFEPDGLTAKSIKKQGETDLSALDIPYTGYEMLLRFDVTNDYWVLLNPGTYNNTLNGYNGNAGFEGNLAGWTLSDPSVVIDTTTYFSGAQSVKIPAGETLTTPLIHLQDYYIDYITFSCQFLSAATTDAWSITAKFYDASKVYIAGDDITVANVTTGNASDVWNTDSAVLYPALTARYVEFVFTSTTGTLWVDNMTLTKTNFECQYDLIGTTGHTGADDLKVVSFSGSGASLPSFDYATTGYSYYPDMVRVPVGGELFLSATVEESSINAYFQFQKNGTTTLGTNYTSITSSPYTFTQTISGFVEGDCLGMRVYQSNPNILRVTNFYAAVQYTTISPFSDGSSAGRTFC